MDAAIREANGTMTPESNSFPLIDEYGITTFEFVGADDTVAFDIRAHDFEYEERYPNPLVSRDAWDNDSSIAQMTVAVTISDRPIAENLASLIGDWEMQLRIRDPDRCYQYTFDHQSLSFTPYTGEERWDIEYTTTFAQSHPFCAYFRTVNAPPCRRGGATRVDVATINEQFPFVTMAEMKMVDNGNYCTDIESLVDDGDTDPNDGDDTSIEDVLEEPNIDRDAIMDEIDGDVDTEPDDLLSMFDSDDIDDNRIYALLAPLSDKGLRDNEYAVQIGGPWYAVDIGHFFTPEGFEDQFVGKQRQKIEQHSAVQIVSEITLDSANQWQYESAVDEVSSDTDSAYTYECTMPSCDTTVDLDTRHNMIRHECQTCGKTTQFEHVT